MTNEARWSPEALYAHFDDKIDSLQDHFDKRLTAINDEIDQRVKTVRDEIDTRARDQKIAIDKAEAAASALAHTHNDLIRKGERDAASYVTKDELSHLITAIGKLQAFQSKILGALAVASIIVPTVTGVIVYVLTKGSATSALTAIVKYFGF